MTDSLRAEQVRAAVLEYLATRPSLSYDLPLLLRQVNKSRALDYEVTADDLTGAVAFLEDKGLIKHSFSLLGSTRFFQATAAGCLAHERGTLDQT